jgi:hypothetical protein
MRRFTCISAYFMVKEVFEAVRPVFAIVIHGEMKRG